MSDEEVRSGAAVTSPVDSAPLPASPGRASATAARALGGRGRASRLSHRRRRAQVTPGAMGQVSGGLTARRAARSAVPLRLSWLGGA